MNDSVGRMQGKTVDYDAIKRAAWQKDEILVVNLPATSLPWDDRALLRSIGNRLYGRRKTA